MSRRPASFVKPVLWAISLRRVRPVATARTVARYATTSRRPSSWSRDVSTSWRTSQRGQSDSRATLSASEDDGSTAARERCARRRSQAVLSSRRSVSRSIRRGLRRCSADATAAIEHACNRHDTRRHANMNAGSGATERVTLGAATAVRRPRIGRDAPSRPSGMTTMASPSVGNDDGTTKAIAPRSSRAKSRPSSVGRNAVESRESDRPFRHEFTHGGWPSAPAVDRPDPRPDPRPAPPAPDPAPPPRRCPRR